MFIVSFLFVIIFGVIGFFERQSDDTEKSIITGN